MAYTTSHGNAWIRVAMTWWGVLYHAQGGTMWNVMCYLTNGTHRSESIVSVFPLIPWDAFVFGKWNWRSIYLDVFIFTFWRRSRSWNTFAMPPDHFMYNEKQMSSLKRAWRILQNPSASFKFSFMWVFPEKWREGNYIANNSSAIVP